MGLGPHPRGRVNGPKKRPRTPTPGGDEIPPYMSGVGPPAMRPRNPPPGGDEKRPRQRYMSGVGAPAARPRNPLSVSPPRGELYGPALCP
eukprot:gene10667-biopygen1779